MLAERWLPFSIAWPGHLRRIDFGPDGNLWITTGDAADPYEAQNVDYLGGKTLCVAPAGEPAPGNPVPGSPVYWVGHRNVQGIGFHPSWKVFASELDEFDFDEVNQIVSAGSYGWPFHEGFGSAPTYRDPFAVAGPTSEMSPSGLAVVPQGANNRWTGDLLVGGLAGERMWRLDLDAGGNLVGTSFLFRDWFGRVRHLEPAPDGSLWMLTTNHIWRLLPPG